MSSNAGSVFTPATIKSIFRPFFSGQKSSFLSEALARACGYQTHAAYSADLRNDDCWLIEVTRISTEHFAARLSELSGIGVDEAKVKMEKAIEDIQGERELPPTIPLGARSTLPRSGDMLLQDFNHVFASNPMTATGEPNPRVLVVMFPDGVVEAAKSTIASQILEDIYPGVYEPL